MNAAGIIAIFFAFLMICNLPKAYAETDTKIKNFVEDIASQDALKKAVMIGYWNGVMDTTMNFGTQLKAVCFPQPMPSRMDFWKQFVSDIELYKTEMGTETVMNMQIDRFLGLTWKKRYACVFK